MSATLRVTLTAQVGFFGCRGQPGRPGYDESVHDADTASDWDVAGQLRVLLRRWKTVAVVVVLVVGAATAISLTQDARYQGSVELLLQRPESEQILDLDQSQSGSDQAR